MNKVLLEYELKRRGLTITELCDKLDISRSTYYRKVKGDSEFTQKEIQEIMSFLNLDSPMDIFFANKVS